jgi:GNAT superfamily N-acetyltransferase
MVIRRARASESAALTALCVRSKAHWGYDAGFMQAAASELTVPPSLIEQAHVFVGEAENVLVAFYSLLDDDGHPALRDLFVAPERIGSGVGRAMWLHLLATARQVGYRQLRIVADPHAEGFYLRMGASRVGAIPSTVQHGRMLPLLSLTL